MTQHHQLTESWIQVASGACFLEVVKGATHIHFGAQPPAGGSKAFHIIDRPFSPCLSYGGTLKAWVRAANTTSEIIVTEAT